MKLGEGEAHDYHAAAATTLTRTSRVKVLASFPGLPYVLANDAIVVTVRI